MSDKDASPVDLREACVVAAHAVIAEQGVEKLSLRDVARRLGVSHQAPYKHYESRDHLLAEVMRRCFERFAAYLEASSRQGDPEKALMALGEAYQRYAEHNPLEYRLMFATPWPQAIEHPGLLRDCRYAFDVLRKALREMRGERADSVQIDLDALFAWSAMHGLATIMESNVVERLQLRKSVRTKARRHTLSMVQAALRATQAPE